MTAQVAQGVAPRGRVVRDLALGARLTLAGGRAGLLRSAITALGVALGVAVLLIAASIPAIHDGRQARGQARSDLGESGAAGAGGATDGGAAGASGAAGAGGATDGGAAGESGAAGAARAGGVLVADADTRFRGRDIRGRLLQGDAFPPGTTRVPRAGEVFVSPALRDLLATPDGRRLLAPRIPGRVVGTIAPAGLLGPTDLAFYAGARDLTEGAGVRRIEDFGSNAAPTPLNPILALLIVIVLVALLLPVAVLVGAAVRTGGEDRDRRLAALRLIGADQRMARRIAAGEALISAGAGLVLGALAFVVLRGFADHVSIWDVSVYPRDVTPSPLLGAAVVAGVPAAAVLVSLLALRRVVAEPLGVVRRAEAARRRRLWWRLLLPVAGLLALVPAAGDTTENVGELQVAVGVIALLVGVAALLPWVVERVVARLGGGKVAWQLAVRRLQLDPGGPARAVSGITVAVAGAIALQMVFTGIQDDFTKNTGADLNRATLYAQFEGRGVGADALGRRLGAFAALTQYTPEEPDATLTVAPCAALREVARVGDCRDGDIFAAGATPPARLTFGATTWQVPDGVKTAATREDPTGLMRTGLFATPGALRGAQLPRPFVFAWVRAPGADAQERVRNAAATLSPRIDVQELRRTRTDSQFAQLRRAMLIGASIVIGLIGLSLLLTALEQLRERRRLLAVLVAFGTRRSTLSWSVLWQAAVPVALGIGIAVVTGVALGAVLLRILDTTVRVAWGDAAAMALVGVLVVLLVTAASLPVLWRTMRPEGLRTE
ncbi:FtsX-like permease family protein [Solirubrobacter soli]|uniref:FtsX-like permease family protein n=1 Tax=Solirubrobacter soli TaxID=363832 RepID=UPI00041235EF|nr:FtsX-like permease family protein [Solirubrobacter soli]